MNATGSGDLGSIEGLQGELEAASYFADRSLATTLFLALTLEKPVLLEGETGVGKTEVAKILAQQLERHLIRLQCWEGLDLSTAVYEWDYARQLLHLRLQEVAGEVDREAVRHELFGSEFLLERPLLRALRLDDRGVAPVLLVDELDRADGEFEAFLLELLSEFQVSIPEIGTVRAVRPPIVVITSNRTREIHDALRRRCLYHWVDFPSLEKEYRIVRAKVPGASEGLSRQVVAFVQSLRQDELYKRPGVAETLDWTQALLRLDREVLDAEVVDATLGVILKYQDDIEEVRRGGIEDRLASIAS